MERSGGGQTEMMFFPKDSRRKTVIKRPFDSKKPDLIYDKAQGRYVTEEAKEKLRKIRKVNEDEQMLKLRAIGELKGKSIRRKMRDREDLKSATFGCGSFWLTDAIFRRINGIEEIICGYAGGDTKDPTYNDICQGKGGHAEVV